MSRKKKATPKVSAYRAYATSYDLKAGIDQLVEWTLDAICCGQFDNNELIELSTIHRIAGWMPPEQTNRTDVQHALYIERSIISGWVEGVSAHSGRKPCRPDRSKQSGYVIPLSGKISGIVELEAIRACNRATKRGLKYALRVKDTDLTSAERTDKNNTITRLSKAAALHETYEEYCADNIRLGTSHARPSPPWL